MTDPGISSLAYVALGDSYTIGTSAGEAERWPNQLVARVPQLELSANLGVNGFTSGDLIRTELPRLASLRLGFASLLVGVNDVVRRVPEDEYRGNAELILDRLIEILPAGRIVTVATPDYTVTPEGASYGDPATQSAGISRCNEILQALAAERSIAFVDIFDISRAAAGDRSLVAADGLHPSGRQYALWVDRIAPVVAELLGH